MTTKNFAPALSLEALLQNLKFFFGTSAEETFNDASPEHVDIASYKNANGAVRAILNEPSEKNWGTNSGWASKDVFGPLDDKQKWIDGLEGSSFNDELYGNDQDNFFIGGAGKDTIIGGGGRDTLSYATAASAILINNSGYDAGAGDAAGDVIQSVENIIGSSFDDTITGSSLDNIVFGGAGNDLLDGARGADTFQGGEGIDTVTYRLYSSSVDVSLVTGGRLNDAEGDIFESIENLIGSKWEDTLEGNDGDNIIDGYLAVGTVADIMRGKGGNDTYYVTQTDGGETSAVIEEANAGTDLVMTKFNYTLTANVENLTAIEGASANLLTGNELNNIINGNSFNNTINGASGADVMIGGNGSDTYYVDNIGDSVIEAAGAGSDTVFTSISYALSANVENLTALGGVSGLTLTGNELNNIITGNELANTLIGGSGVDTLDGGAGDDLYIINDASDIIRDSAGRDIVQTTVVLSASQMSGIEFVELLGAAKLAATGNDANNTLIGNAGSNQLAGGLGNDTLTGGDGKDFFIFNKKLDKKKNVDTITDFNSKLDDIWLENSVFKNMGTKGSLKKPSKIKKDYFYAGTKAHDADDHIIYDKKKGILYYDPDGKGGKGQIQFAKIDKKKPVAWHDFFMI